MLLRWGHKNLHMHACNSTQTQWLHLSINPLCEVMKNWRLLLCTLSESAVTKLWVFESVGRVDLTPTQQKPIKYQLSIIHAHTAMMLPYTQVFKACTCNYHPTKTLKHTHWHSCPTQHWFFNFICKNWLKLSQNGDEVFHPAPISLLLLLGFNPGDKKL